MGAGTEETGEGRERFGKLGSLFVRGREGRGGICWAKEYVSGDLERTAEVSGGGEGRSGVAMVPCEGKEASRKSRGSEAGGTTRE